MRKKLIVGYLLLLLTLVVLQVAAPQSKPPEPDQPLIWLYSCWYDAQGHLINFDCCTYPTVECIWQSCDEWW